MASDSPDSRRKHPHSPSDDESRDRSKRHKHRHHHRHHHRSHRHSSRGNDRDDGRIGDVEVTNVEENLGGVQGAIEAAHSIQDKAESDMEEGEIVAAFDNKISSKYLLEAKPTPENIENFCSRLLDGTMQEYFKSQPIPNNADARVKIVVGKTFDELVLSSSKNVLLEVHTPWCMDCDTTSKQVEKLAKHFKGLDSLIFAKIDASVNEHPKLEVFQWRESENCCYWVDLVRRNASLQP